MGAASGGRGMIRLRETAEQDLDFVIAAERAEENRPFVAQWTWEQHRAALADPDVRHLVIERSGDHTPVGYVILAGLESPHQSVEFRRIVVTEKGRGYGKGALRLVKQLAFEQLGAHRLWLDVKDHNARARHVYGAEGFVVEGTLRECFKAGEAFESLVVMPLLREEYEWAMDKGHSAESTSCRELIREDPHGSADGRPS